MAEGEELHEEYEKSAWKLDILQVRLYHEAKSIQQELERLDELTDLTSGLFADNMASFRNKATIYLKESAPHAENHELNRFRVSFNTAITRLIKDVEIAHKKTKTDITTRSL